MHLRKLYSELKHVEEELDDLITARTNASPDARGGIVNRINHLKKSRTELTEEISCEENRFTLPNDLVKLYVIVANKPKIIDIHDDQYVCLIEENRYHTDLSEWRPFSDYHGDIGEMITELKQSYRFSEYYIDNDEDYEYALKVQDEELVSIGIVDLLSINDDNIELVKCFDKPKIAGLILPKCRQIVKKDLLHKYWKNIREDVFKMNEKRNTTHNPCTNYFFELSEYNSFTAQLKRFFKKYPVKNQSSNDSSVRNIIKNMGL